MPGQLKDRKLALIMDAGAMERTRTGKKRGCGKSRRTHLQNMLRLQSTGLGNEGAWSDERCLSMEGEGSTTRQGQDAGAWQGKAMARTSCVLPGLAGSARKRTNGN